MASDNPKLFGVFVNAVTGEEIIRELTPEEIAQLVVITEATDETPTAD